MTEQTSNPTPEQTGFVRIACTAWRLGQSIEIRGRKLVHRPGRDEDVVLDRGVRIVSGKFQGWGGSRNNPKLEANDAIIEFAASRAMYDYIVEHEDDAAEWSDEPTPEPVDTLPTW